MFQCWTSRVRDSMGVERVSRGCTNHPEQVPLYCFYASQSSSMHQKRHSGGQYAITCCEGDLCNNGTFPELQRVIYRGKH